IVLCVSSSAVPRRRHSLPTRRSSDLPRGGHRRPHEGQEGPQGGARRAGGGAVARRGGGAALPRPGTAVPVREAVRRTARGSAGRSEEHTSELQSRFDLVCRLLLEKKK